MKREYLKNSWRKLDNTAKVFSLDDKKNTNVFRYSVILSDKIVPEILEDAIKKTLEMYPEYGVKIRMGFFWSYLDNNKKMAIVEEEKEIPCKEINFRKNNDHLFKVTYFNNKINLDIYHVLTDGVGAVRFLKGILYNYLDLRYKIRVDKVDIVNKFEYVQDEYLKNADKKLVCKEKYRRVFSIKDKANFMINKTYHYIFDLDKFKNKCREKKVSITEYLTALYIYAIYRSVYKKNSNKDIAVTVPIDLRRYYQVESFSNFFICMNVLGDVVKNKKISFDKILLQVHREFKRKLAESNIKRYLARDVRLGTNMAIRLVPLSVKKIFMKYMSKVVNPTTTTLSNIGPIKIDKEYIKYVDNIMVLVSTGKDQRVKCTVCSYENNLTVTLNSNLVNNRLEDEFYKLLKRHIGKIKLISNTV